MIGLHLNTRNLKIWPYLGKKKGFENVIKLRILKWDHPLLSNWTPNPITSVKRLNWLISVILDQGNTCALGKLTKGGGCRVEAKESRQRTGAENSISKLLSLDLKQQIVTFLWHQFRLTGIPFPPFKKKNFLKLVHFKVQFSHVTLSTSDSPLVWIGLLGGRD